MSELRKELIRVIRGYWTRHGDHGDMDAWDHIKEDCGPCCALDLCDDVEDYTRAAHPAVEVLDEIQEWLESHDQLPPWSPVGQALRAFNKLRAAKGV